MKIKLSELRLAGVFLFFLLDNQKAYIYLKFGKNQAKIVQS